MDVLMPQLGETVAEGKITQWFKAAGEKVAPGDNLFEIETDKVSMEVPSTTSGVLAEIRIRAGEIAAVGAVVAVIADGGAPKPIKHTQDLPALALAQSPAANLDPFFEVRTPERNYGPARLPGGTATTPLARRLAAERGIDLSMLQGSGPHGRIVARDVQGARAPVMRVPASPVPAHDVRL